MPAFSISLFVSRRIFDLLKRHDDECLTDIHRAVKWFYLLKTAFAGHIEKPNFAYGTDRPPSLNLLNLEETILQIRWRLSRVYLENREYRDVISRYDRPHTFFYVDPPYWGMDVYRFNFKPEDFAELAEAWAG